MLIDLIDKLITRLLDYANDNLQNSNGIFNSVVILNAVDKKILTQNSDAVREFLIQAEKMGSKTKLSFL